MTVISSVFQLIGSLGFLLFGMKLMSDGIQKSAGKSLHKVLGLMTSNRFFALLTGLFITTIIQSSSATTVMVVSFVNAGLLTLAQSIGVIFGANIGTTITAWIVALFGFKFQIAALAIPVFGIGYILYSIKKFKKETIGEALMGFGLLFVGLDLLGEVMTFDAEQVLFLQHLTGNGYLSILAGVLAGLVITMLIHSSSASTAIILTMSYNKLLPWEFAAAMVLGSNIGTTIDAVLASIGTKVNARRAALIHVLFNVIGSVIAIILFKPFLLVVDFIVPGPVESSITTHIAMLHTVFNVMNSLLFLPFVNQLAFLSEKIITPKKGETPDVYKLDFIPPGMKDNYEAYIIQAEKEIADMTDIVMDMFTTVQKGFVNRTEEFIEEHYEKLSKQEDYADQMQEQISNFLVQYSHLPIADRTKHNVSIMLRIIDDLESITDECFSILLLLKRSIKKDMTFNDEDMERLEPYGELVQQFLLFIKKNINKHLSRDQLRLAEVLEDQVDAFRKNLKKVARKRLEKGADVRSELLYIDLVRY
ncbi:MAG: Na/Pi cotransporter family protein, partial [Spirochaetota bacterium]|nr:Na/Pi cotransporter family protein [Spirochaetota bacterium]